MGNIIWFCILILEVKMFICRRGWGEVGEVISRAGPGVFS